MKVAIVGSRDFTNYKLFSAEVDRILIEKDWNITEIVSGGASGADRLAWRYAIIKKLLYKEFPADWKNFGKAAGHMRNTLIIDYCDVVIAFWMNKSPGTFDSITKAKLQGKPVIIVECSNLNKLKILDEETLL